MKHSNVALFPLLALTLAACAMKPAQKPEQIGTEWHWYQMGCDNRGHCFGGLRTANGSQDNGMCRDIPRLGKDVMCMLMRTKAGNYVPVQVVSGPHDDVVYDDNGNKL